MVQTSSLGLASPVRDITTPDSLLSDTQQTRDTEVTSWIYLHSWLYLHIPLSIYLSTQEVTSAPSSPLTLAKTPDSALRSSEARPGGGGSRWG